MSNKIYVAESRINDEIPFISGKVRIVGDGIESQILTYYDAKKMAREMNMDLIEVSLNSQFPVLRIGNYEKIMYEKKKAAKKNAQSRTELKEIQLSANIALHDLEIKASKCREFIEKGNNVKIILTLKGREMNYKENNQKSLLQFINMLGDVAAPQSMPKEINNKFIVILNKKKC